MTRGAIIGKAVSGKATLCYRFLLRFDVASIPPAAVIANATLTLVTAINVNATEATFDAYRLTRSDWTELGATWNQYDGIHDWATPGGDFTTDNSASGMLDADDELIIATLAPLVADAIAFRNGMLELAIVGPEEGESSYTIVGTSDASGDPSLRPLLVVEYGFEPQLAVTDHGDNTGATASLGGTAEGSTVVYVQSFAGELGQGAWTAAGSITGDGDVELALPAGHYFAYAVTTIDSVPYVSPVAYFIVTDGLESIHSRCLTAVQARVRLLGLDGLADGQVVIEKVSAGRNLASAVGLPAIVISPHRSAMPADAGTNGSDDVHYDVLVAIFDRDNQEPTLRGKSRSSLVVASADCPGVSQPATGGRAGGDQCGSRAGRGAVGRGLETRADGVGRAVAFYQSRNAWILDEERNRSWHRLRPRWAIRPNWAPRTKPTYGSAVTVDEGFVFVSESIVKRGVIVERTGLRGTRSHQSRRHARRALHGGRAACARAHARGPGHLAAAHPGRRGRRHDLRPGRNASELYPFDRSRGQGVHVRRLQGQSRHACRARRAACCG